MDLINLLIAVTAMLAGCISAYYAFKARQNTKKIIDKLNIRQEVENRGNNYGVMSNNINGSVNNAREK